MLVQVKVLQLELGGQVRFTQAEAEEAVQAVMMVELAVQAVVGVVAQEIKLDMLVALILEEAAGEEINVVIMMAEMVVQELYC